MNVYLGEKPVIDFVGTPYEGFTPTKWALEFVTCYGQIDGEHHKAWVLDQAARILCGTPVIVKEATWGPKDGDGSAIALTEYRTQTGEPSAKYLAWVASQKSDKRPRLDAGASPAELALEFIAVHGVHEQPNLYSKSEEERLSTNRRLHALAQHKAWMLDQVARILLGAGVTSVETIEISSQSVKYLEWVEEMLGEERDGEREYDYNCGEPLPESKRGAQCAYYAGIAP